MKPTTTLSSYALSSDSNKASTILTSSLLIASIVGFSAGAANAAPVAMPSYNDANSELVNQGAYIARQADCMGCHKEDYSGGIALETPMGKIYATNITPSIRYGIGEYTEQDLKNALTKGKAPSHQLYPAMPYPAYSGMTDEDIHALFAYLQTVPAIDEEPEYKTKLPFPFSIRPLMIGWKMINMPDWQTNADLDDTQQYGKYLVDNLAHCGTCHTPRNTTMGYDMDNYLSGAMLGNWHAPNITPDPTSGIGSWSEQEIVTYLRDGSVHKKALAAGPMSEVVMNSTRYLKDSDLNAIASYLKAVPAIQTDDTLQAVDTEALPERQNEDLRFNLLEQINYLDAAHSQASSANESLYLSNCASCHGVDGYGQPDAGYAPIVGLSSLRRDSADPVIGVVAHGIQQVVNTRPRMPGFKDDLSAEEIAGIVNYVRTTFGGVPTSDVTGEEVDRYLNKKADVPFLIKNAGWLSIVGIVIGLIILFLLIRWFIRRR